MRASSRGRRSRWIRPQPSCTTRRKSSKGSRPIAPPTAARPCSGRRRMPGASRSRPSGWPCRSCRRTLFLEACDRLVNIDRAWIPDGDGSLYLRPFMFANEIFLGVKPSSDYLFIVIASSVGAYFKTDAPAVSVWVSTDYTRAAPGGTGAAKCGGNYAASLLAQAEATRHGCDQVVFLDAVEQRWVEELGGMNVFFVFDDGSMDDAAARRHDPARHHPRLTAHARQGQGHQGARGPLLDRPVARRRRAAAACARPSPAARPPSSRRSARSAARMASSRSAMAAPAPGPRN